MALLEVTNPVDKIEIVGEFKMMQIRSATWVEKDGVMVGSPQYSRKVITPADDVSNEDPQIQAVASAIFTDEIKAAYAAKLAEQENI